MATIAQRTTGYETVNGTVWATIDRVEQVGEKYVATCGLNTCTKTARWSTEYKRKSAALKAVGLREGDDESLLAAPWTATLINGTSGLPDETITLDPAQRIKSVEKTDRGWSALVSPNGENWYHYVGDAQPFVR